MQGETTLSESRFSWSVFCNEIYDLVLKTDDAPIKEVFAYICMNTCTHACTHIMHTYEHAQTHTHTHAHTHTHTHTAPMHLQHITQPMCYRHFLICIELTSPYTVLHTEENLEHICTCKYNTQLKTTNRPLCVMHGYYSFDKNWSDI